MENSRMDLIVLLIEKPSLEKNPFKFRSGKHIPVDLLKDQKPCLKVLFLGVRVKSTRESAVKRSGSIVTFHMSLLQGVR